MKYQSTVEYFSKYHAIEN